MTAPDRPDDSITERLEALRGLPFPEQRAVIEDCVATGRHGVVLLEATADLPDHEPLALASKLLAEAHQMGQPEVRAALDALLPGLSDTAIQRVLRTLIATQLPQDQLEVMVESVTQTVSELGAARIAALCLMDRWLKNAAPDTHRHLEEESLALVDRVSDAAAATTISDAVLIRLPGPSLGSLSQTAVWGHRLKRFADEVLAVLERAPKSLSQANAEEILSRQVYTDPGHFLIELLQNAEDAGASQWLVEISDHQLSVWHDGADFDARDVVGLLSIGQSTKSRGQIGFFGVGFKSVYEVCERPQVYSGLFDFEIADVSLPRRLGGRPEGQREDGTLLVLPLREVDDPLRRPELLFQYACNVPAETLLTLENLRQIGAKYGHRSRTFVRRPGSRAHRIELVNQEEEEVLSYFVISDHFSYEGSRETHRAESSPVLVAIRLDDDGHPQPLPDHNATVFSYLPTGESSGLRFMVHAHFDLPVDRERLDLDTHWNVWALEKAGDLLARCAKTLVDEYQKSESPKAARRLEALLQVFPRHGELGRQGYERIFERLREGVEDIPMLLGRGGELLRPTQACIMVDEALADVLAGIEATRDGRFAMAPLASREATVAQGLGATLFGAAELVELLQRTAVASEDKQPPTWLIEALPTIFDFLGLADTNIESLKNLPLIPDHQGFLRLPKEVVTADADLRKLYGDLRPFVDLTLDVMATTGQRRLLRMLGVGRMEGADLVADLLRMPTFVADIMEGQRGIALLKYCEDLPPKLIADLGQLQIIYDEWGQPGALRRRHPSDSALWLIPKGDLGVLVRSIEHRELRFVSVELQERFTALLEGLGGEYLTLEVLLEALGKQELALSDHELSRLHATLEAHRHELTPRICRSLSEASLFTDITGRRRPLRGSGKALIPADEDLPELIPSSPWVVPEVASLSYVSRGLGIAQIGPVEVIRALLLEEEGDDASLLIDPFDDAQLRSCYAYLIARSDGIPRNLCERLAEAPLWLDVRGERCTLEELRMPPVSTKLAALYDAWGVLREIESGTGSTATLVAALGLADRVHPTNHSMLIEDLKKCDDAGTLRIGRDLLGPALEESRAELSLREFRTLRDAPIFRDDQGTLRPLRRWSESEKYDRCARALGPLREVLSLGSSPLLSMDEERDLEAVLGFLDAEPADVEDLVSELERDPLLSQDESLYRAREALAAMARELAMAFTPPSDGRGHPRLQALPIWPTEQVDHRTAGEVVRPDDLRELIPDQEGYAEIGEQKISILLSSALEQADALRGLFKFRDPVELIIAGVQEQARVGVPLSEQGTLLRQVGRIVKILRICYDYLGSADAVLELPLVVDGKGQLAKGRHFRATALELQLSRNLDKAPKMADTTWSQGARDIDSDLAPPLPARHLLSALAECCRQETAVADHTIFSDLELRQHLYQWLLERRVEIEGDAEARGLLGLAHLIPTAGGVLRAPRSLLLDPSLPDLGLGWGVAEELPGELTEWLRQTYRLDDRQTRQLVEYVVDGHRAAVSQDDVERSGELLHFLGRVLILQAEGDRGATSLETLARRYKLHRTLKIANDRGGFERPGRLISATAEKWALINTFHANPPAHISAHYDREEQSKLLIAAGAMGDLELESLKHLLKDGTWLRPGAEARTALARYIALRLLEKPAVKNELRLDRTKWIPNGAGDMCRPSDLFWPNERLRAILGDQLRSFPDAEIVHTSPEELRRALPFMHAKDVTLDLVVERLAGLDGPAPHALLDWLEDGLAKKRLAPGELRTQLAHLPFLADDQRRLWAPVDMVSFEARELFAGRRGSWSDTRRWPRLASALRITSTRRLYQKVQLFLEEVGEDVAERGGDVLLSTEPDLGRALPKCLEHLALESKASSDRLPPDPSCLPLLCFDVYNTLVISLSTNPRVVRPQPEPLVDLAKELSLPLLYPVLPTDAVDETLRFLRRLGLADLWSRWRFRQLEVEIDESPAMGIEAQRLESTLEALWPLLPRLVVLGSPRGHPPMVRPASSIRVEGTLDGAPGSASFVCLWDRKGNNILSTAEGFVELEEVALELWRGLSIPSTGDDEGLLELLTQLLSLERASDMEALLDQRGLTRSIERGPYRQHQGQRSQREPPKKKDNRRNQHDEDDDAPRSSVSPSPETTHDEERSQRPSSEPEKESSRRGLLSRVRQWLRGSSDDEEEDRERDRERPSEAPKEAPKKPRKKHKTSAPRPPKPPDRRLARNRGAGDHEASRAPQHAQWFKPDDSQESQLRAAPAWLDDRQRPPEFGFAFAPTRLDLPWTYAVKLLSSRFDRHSQSWSHDVADPAWWSPTGQRVAEVRLKGTVPKGHVVLPVPLYGRVVDFVASPSARRVETRDGRTMLLTEGRTDLAYTVLLHRTPPFELGGATSLEPPDTLLTHTVPDSELPEEVHLFLDEIVDNIESTLHWRATSVRDFIRSRYRYDPSYLEDEGIARWLRNVSFSRPNVHIAALHAGRDGRHLGRGVCYDLNVLACELLRRAGVPSAIATGWTFSGGSLAEPDHLWAMALLPTDEGWRWLPIDAATTGEGRPLQIPRRPPGPWRVKAPPQRQAQRRSTRRKERKPPASVPRSATTGGVRRAEKVKAPPRLPITELVRLAKHLEAVTGERLGDTTKLRKRFELLLRDQERVSKLLRLLKG